MRNRISDKELAKAARVSPQTIVNWKKNQKRNRLYNLLKTGFVCERKKERVDIAAENAEELLNLLGVAGKRIPGRYFDILYALALSVHDNLQELRKAMRDVLPEEIKGKDAHGRAEKEKKEL